MPAQFSWPEIRVHVNWPSICVSCPPTTIFKWARKWPAAQCTGGLADWSGVSAERRLCIHSSNWPTREDQQEPDLDSRLLVALAKC